VVVVVVAVVGVVVGVVVVVVVVVAAAAAAVAVVVVAAAVAAVVNTQRMKTKSHGTKTMNNHLSARKAANAASLASAPLCIWSRAQTL
jgi:hypothetical protein